MANCQNCGTQLGNEKFCGGCGTPVPTAEQQPQQGYQQQRYPQGNITDAQMKNGIR